MSKKLELRMLDLEKRVIYLELFSLTQKKVIEELARVINVEIYDIDIDIDDI